MSLEQFGNFSHCFLIDCLEGINRSAEDLQKLLKMYQKLEIFCIGNNLENSVIFKKVREKVFCVICKEKPGAILLSCNHFLCEPCLKHTVLRQTQGFIFLNTFESDLIPKCPMQNCPIIINQKQYEVFFQETFEDLQESCRKRRISRKEKDMLKTFCRTCERPRKPEHFFFACKHICLFCSSFDMNRSLDSCFVCSQENLLLIKNFPSLPSDEKQEKSFQVKTNDLMLRSINQLRCSRCHDDQFFDNLFLEVCQDYVLCIHCLKRFWSEIICQNCRKSIQTHESFDLIRKHLFKTCENCGNSVPFDFILPLFCCSSMFCMYCQVNFNQSAEHMLKNHCLNCKTPLEVHLIQLLDNLTQ
jgi:hypothetical protein